MHTKNWNVDVDIINSRDMFTQPEVMERFWNMYQRGMLTPNDVFDISRREHIQQAQMTYELLNATKDWDSFYNIMWWLRYHVSTEMFTYALTSTVIHNERFAGIEMPAIYEIHPHYFFNSYTMERARLEKMGGIDHMKLVDGMQEMILWANYTDRKLLLNEEQKLAYFHEDIGLNSWYYYAHMDYPFWMDAENDRTWNDRRGERYMWIHWQLLKRYHLERLSNNMYDIKEFSWDHHIPTGYYPQLAYYNGEKFPARGNSYNLQNPQNWNAIEMLKMWERRLMEAIDSGFAIMDDGTRVNITNNVEELARVFMSLSNSGYSRYYGMYEVLAKRILSAPVSVIDEHNAIPGAMQHFETALRDPMFYQLYKRIMQKFMHWQRFRPSYTRQDLDFNGVEIKSVEMDKLITYFDVFDADITNAVDVILNQDMNDNLEKFIIKARNWRLNHLPFTVKLNVNSNRAQRAVVQMFIVSKYDAYGREYSMEQNRENFLEMDKWMVDLKEGMNMINRQSSSFSYYVKDRTQYRTMMRNIYQKKWEMDNTEAHCGFPERLMLPRGKKEGMQFEFFFIVSPWIEPTNTQRQTYDQNIVCGIGSGNRWIDARPFGWPFDRPINMEHWYTPNMHTYEAKIFHKKQSEINSA